MNGIINSFVNRQRMTDLSKISSEKLQERILNLQFHIGSINDAIASLRERNKELEREAQKLYREGDNNPEKRDEIEFDLDFISESIADNIVELQGLKESKRLAAMYLNDLEHEMRVRNSVIYSKEATEIILEIRKKQIVAREIRADAISKQSGINKTMSSISRPQDVPDLTREAHLRWEAADKQRLFKPTITKSKTAADIATQD